MKKFFAVMLFASLAAPLPAAMLLPIHMSGRIVTPNGDGINDTVTFSLQNPDSTLPDATVYNIRGRRVAHLTANSPSQLAWNGQDEDGRAVESGVYLVQITRADGSLFNGIVTVVR